jgi:hypothetical protein
VLALTGDSDRIRRQSAALTDFMAKSALLQDIAAVKQQHIPAAMAPMPIPQQAAPAGNMPQQQAVQQTQAQPMDQAPQDQPAAPAPAPDAGPQAAPDNSFTLKYVQDKVSKKASIENGQVTIHADSNEEAAQLDRALQNERAKNEGVIDLGNVTVVSDEAISNRQALREEQQAIARKREAEAAANETSKGIDASTPLLQGVGATVMKDQEGGSHIVGPNGAPAGLYEIANVPDPEDKTKMVQQVTGASQEKAANVISSLADSANPDSARAVIRDMGQGIKEYVLDLASHKDLEPTGKSNEFRLNLFGRDPDNALKIAMGLSKLSATAKSSGVLPKIIIPGPGEATYQFTQYANGVRKTEGAGDSRVKEGNLGFPDKGTGRVSEGVGNYHNDAAKLIGHLSQYVDRTTGKLSEKDSWGVVSSFEHPGSGPGLALFIKSLGPTVIDERLLNLLAPQAKNYLVAQAKAGKL